MPVCSECFAKLDSMHVSGCWKCGAGFRSEGNWKPVPASHAPTVSPAAPPARVLRNIVLFTAPAWGVVLLILILKIAGPRAGDAGSVLLLGGGALLPVGFLRVIWSTAVLGMVGKGLVSVLYYGASCFGMFAVGWAALMYLSPVR
jgi:hypothetical protein